jgi:hypothetical protein
VPISGGFFITFLAMVVFPQAEAYPGFIPTWLLFGCGVGLLSPAYQSLISKVVLRSLGAFSGLFQGSLGFIAASTWLGAAVGALQLRLPFVITAWFLSSPSSQPGRFSTAEGATRETQATEISAMYCQSKKPESHSILTTDEHRWTLIHLIHILICANQCICGFSSGETT